MRAIQIFLTSLAISTCWISTSSAKCNYANAENLVCEFEVCGDTICMKCKDIGGGGTLECPPEKAFKGTQSSLGGDLLQIPKIAGYNLTNFHKAATSGAQMSSANVEWYRNHIENQNSSLESFRRKLEKARNERSILTVEYQRGINFYKEGIQNYFKGINVVTSTKK